MDIEIKFLNSEKILIDFTKEKIIELSKENNWELFIQDKPMMDYKNGSYEFSLYQDKNLNSLLLTAIIICELFTDIWFLKEMDENPKKHFKNCYYIMKILYVGDFEIKNLLDFSIKFVEKIPNTIVETMENNSITMFEEYNLSDLYYIKEHYSNMDWKLIRMLGSA